MNRWLVFIPLLLFVGLSVFLLRGLDRDPNAMPSALIDREMPQFALRRLLHPEDIVNREALTGKPALLNVWATWCAACRVEHPFLNQLAEQGVTLFGVNYKDDPAAAIRWLEAGGNPYKLNLMDLDGRLGLDLGVFGAPETYLLDAAGIIRFKHVGVLTPEIWETEFLPRIEKIADPEPSASEGIGD
ncbi:MAG: DsbE family thiol:disulfide interchange protein [bacterium]